MGVAGTKLDYPIHMPAIYYMPGRGGRLSAGLGLELSARGYDLIGREIAGPGPRDQSNPFASLSFQQQIEVIQHDLKTHFWTPEALVIGNSFGAYLIAHSILQSGCFPGQCLFISPVLGAVKTTGMLFKPPKSGALKDAIDNQSYPSIILDISSVQETNTTFPISLKNWIESRSAALRRSMVKGTVLITRF